MQIREVTVGCFLSATIVLVGVLWTLVVKNIELQKNSLLDNEEIQTIESETGWKQQGSDWYYYDESGNPLQNEWGRAVIIILAKMGKNGSKSICGSFFCVTIWKLESKI